MVQLRGNWEGSVESKELFFYLYAHTPTDRTVYARVPFAIVLSKENVWILPGDKDITFFPAAAIEHCWLGQGWLRG